MGKDVKFSKYFASSTEGVDIQNISAGQVAVFSCPSTNQAEDNQDSAGFIPLRDNEVVLALSDGAGGHQGGQNASQTIIKALIDELLHDDNHDQLIRASVLNALETANKTIIETKSGAGATACVVTIEKNIFRPFHVGDSIIAVIGQKGKLVYRNIEHSPIGYALRSELVDEKEIANAASNEVFNLVGNAEMHIELGPEIELKSNDTIFICSDGITDIISLEECLKMIRAGEFSLVANQLADKFYQTTENIENKDDATFILFRLN
jgi:serine/threonine protein phosphatase PrpC